MKITVISGSHRTDSQSEKVGRYVVGALAQLGQQGQLISLANNPLPLWEEAIFAGDEDWKARLAPMSAQLIESDGFVIIAPEWHGQIPSGLKNFLMMWSRGELAHKPALIMTVSSSDGGAYPVAELRMSSYKNNRICYIPEQIIVRHVESVLNDDVTKNDPESDAYFRKRINWTLEMLVQYAEALASVRQSGITRHSDFPNGM